MCIQQINIHILYIYVYILSVSILTDGNDWTLMMRNFKKSPHNKNLRGIINCGEKKGATNQYKCGFQLGSGVFGKCRTFLWMKNTINFVAFITELSMIMDKLIRGLRPTFSIPLVNPYCFLTGTFL